MSLAKNIFKNVLQILHDRNIKIGDFAKSLGTTRQNFNRMYSVGDFKINYLEKMATLLEVDPVTLIGEYPEETLIAKEPKENYQKHCDSCEHYKMLIQYMQEDLDKLKAENKKLRAASGLGKKQKAG